MAFWLFCPEGDIVVVCVGFGIAAGFTDDGRIIAILEDIFADGGDAGGNSDLFERSAAGEGLVLNALYTLRDHDAGEATAAEAILRKHMSMDSIIKRKADDVNLFSVFLI